MCEPASFLHGFLNPAGSTYVRVHVHTHTCMCSPGPPASAPSAPLTYKHLTLQQLFQILNDQTISLFKIDFWDVPVNFMLFLLKVICVQQPMSPGHIGGWILQWFVPTASDTEHSAPLFVTACLKCWSSSPLLSDNSDFTQAFDNSVWAEPPADAWGPLLLSAALQNTSSSFWHFTPVKHVFKSRSKQVAVLKQELLVIILVVLGLSFWDPLRWRKNGGAQVDTPERIHEGEPVHNLLELSC